MKKILALILAALMLIGMLAGCSQSDRDDDEPKSESKSESQAAPETEAADKEAEATTPAETEPQPTQPQKEATVGDILDAPEVVFDSSIEDLYIYFSYPGETEDEVKSMELALSQVNEDTYIIYVTDGLLKLHESIYEVSNDGITKYTKDVFADSFQQDTTLTQDQLQQEQTSIFELLLTFMLAHPDWQGMQYCKTNDFAFSVTGDVYTYDLLQNSEVWGKVAIDKATGLLVSLKDASGNNMYTVQALKTSDLDIPEYK